MGDKFFVLRVEETKKLKQLVDKQGFQELILQNPLIPYFEDEAIFKEKNRGKNERKIRSDFMEIWICGQYRQGKTIDYVRSCNCK